MLVTELDEVVEVGRPAVDPVPDVVHVGELGVRAAGETTSLVPPPDLQIAGRRWRSRRVRPRFRLWPSGPSADTSTLASQASRRATSRDTGPEDVELCASVAAGKELHVGVDHHGRAVAAQPAGPVPRPGLAAVPSRRRPRRQRRPCRRRPGRRPSAGRTACGHARRLARASSELLTTAYWSSGSTPGQAPTPIVEAEEASGVEAGRLLVGLVASGHARARGPAWPTSAWPVRPAGRPSRAWPPRRAA